MSARPQSFEFRPILLSRRGEFIAWGAGILLAAAWIFLAITGKPVYLSMAILEVLLIFAAGSMSLGNWMDRHTLLRLDENGLTFQNGLRNLHLGWEEIQEVRVYPTQWGKKVEVIGERVHFQFRTLGEVKVQGDLKGRMGMEQGEEALEGIISNSGLQRIERSGESPREGYYYARK